MCSSDLRDFGAEGVGLCRTEHMYLVHSYYVPIVPETIGTSEYDLKYSIAVKKKNFYGVQFHPEKSSFSGNKLLNNFLKL